MGRTSEKGQLKILVAEREVEVAPGTKLFALRDRLKPGADVVVYNGAPAAAQRKLAEGEEVALLSAVSGG